MSVAKSTAKLKRIAPGEVGSFMKENGLSSIVACDADGWTYKISIFESEGKHYIGGNLIVCDYDETSQIYTLVDGSNIDSVTKVRNLPCSTDLDSREVVERVMSDFLGELKTDYFEIDKVTAERRTDNVGDGSGLTYNDLDVSLWINDES